MVAVYLGCLLLVCSFILFEVLDIDGSDFLPPPMSMDARLVESHHDDLKRVALMLLGAALASGAALLAREALARSARAERVAPHHPVVLISSATRALLARSALADAPSA